MWERGSTRAANQIAGGVCRCFSTFYGSSLFPIAFGRRKTDTIYCLPLNDKQHLKLLTIFQIIRCMPLVHCTLDQRANRRKMFDGVVRHHIRTKEPVAATFTQWVIYRRTLRLWHMMNEWCGRVNGQLKYTKQSYTFPANNTISRLTSGPILFSLVNCRNEVFPFFSLSFSYDSRHLIMLNRFWPFPVWNWATISRICLIAIVGFHYAFNELEKVFSRSNSNSNTAY